MKEYEKPSDDMISLRTLSYYEEEANSIDISFLKDSEIIKKTKSTKKAEELREQKSAQKRTKKRQRKRNSRSSQRNNRRKKRRTNSKRSQRRPSN